MAHSDPILQSALATLPFTPLPSQLSVLAAACSFAVESGERDVFVLNGYAGTGKTSIVGALIRALDSFKRRVVVLAPTGRAAKVASTLSSHPASTIHRRIFRPNPADPSGHSWIVAPNQLRDTLFIVDEASLINDADDMGNRSLLFTLIRYVYSAPGCRMMLVGDEAQLPPVGQSVAMAMNPERLSRLGLKPLYYTLDIPVRQAQGSGIIRNATIVRSCLDKAPERDIPQLAVSNYTDVRVINSQELPDAITDSFAEVGQDETLVITRSNWRANGFNRAIRNMVMFAEQPLERGDRVVVSKNDYFWGKLNKTSPLIANGETAEITWVGKTEKVYGRYFTEVEMKLSDGSIVNVQVMLRSLVSEGPSIPRLEMEKLYNVVLASYEGELSEKIKGAQEDPYYNALQLKYAYCVTCHKAQGGQWKHIYIDMGGIDPQAMGPEFYRWLYTAITRATERVYFVNPAIYIK